MMLDEKFCILIKRIIKADEIWKKLKYVFFCEIVDDKIIKNSDKNINKFSVACTVFHVFCLVIWIIKVLFFWWTIMIYSLAVINAICDIF